MLTTKMNSSLKLTDNLKMLFRSGRKQRSKDQLVDSTITIVSGLPRSGTSMMMKMLEVGGVEPIIDELREADADNPKGYYEFERVKDMGTGDIDWLIDARGKSVKVISMLLKDLPDTYNYEVIFMRRSIAEILASQKKMLLRNDKPTDNISDDMIQQLYEKHLSEVFPWMEAQPCLRFVQINYNDLLQKPQQALTTVNNFLSHDLDVQAMAHIIDPTLYRQRQ
ncbi:MAG: sulfotransferase family protein [Chloroflexota bacterium]